MHKLIAKTPKKATIITRSRKIEDLQRIAVNLSSSDFVIYKPNGEIAYQQRG